MRTNEARWIDDRKRWQINVQKDRVRKTFTSSIEGVKGKIEAEKKADKWLETGSKDDNIRFAELFKRFLEDRKILVGEINYVFRESVGRIWLVPYLKNKRVTNISEQIWQDCITRAYKDGKSKNMIRNIRSTIIQFCKYAKKQGLSVVIPELVIPKDAYQKEKTILQPNDLKVLFANDTILLSGKQKFFFLIYAVRFLVITGLRRGELCALRKEDIYNGVIYVKHSLNRFGKITEGKTKNAQRQFAITELAQSVLDMQNHMLKNRGVISPYLFPDEHGQLLDSNRLYNSWRVYARQYGINCTLHELRHTNISILKADVPEELLKRTIGHSKSMDTFGVYGHNVEGEMQRVAQITDEIFKKILE